MATGVLDEKQVRIKENKDQGIWDISNVFIAGCMSPAGNTVDPWSSNVYVYVYDKLRCIVQEIPGEAVVQGSTETELTDLDEKRFISIKNGERFLFELGGLEEDIYLQRLLPLIDLEIRMFCVQNDLIRDLLGIYHNIESFYNAITGLSVTLKSDPEIQNYKLVCIEIATNGSIEDILKSEASFNDWFVENLPIEKQQFFVITYSL